MIIYLEQSTQVSQSAMEQRQQWSPFSRMRRRMHSRTVASPRDCSHCMVCVPSSTVHSRGNAELSSRCVLYARILKCCNRNCTRLETLGIATVPKPTRIHALLSGRVRSGTFHGRAAPSTGLYKKLPPNQKKHNDERPPTHTHIHLNTHTPLEDPSRRFW